MRANEFVMHGRIKVYSAGDAHNRLHLLRQVFEVHESLTINSILDEAEAEETETAAAGGSNGGLPR